MNLSLFRDKLDSLVFALLPYAGLGNMLFVWARALVFSRLNELPLMTAGWGYIHIGPIIRKERHQRFYGRYFSQIDAVPLWRKWLALSCYTKIHEPEITTLSTLPGRNSLYVFSQIPHWQDYFGSIREHRDMVRSALEQMLKSNYRERLMQLERPWIGVHIRRGDFRPLQPGENFAKVGLVRTPLEYFRELIIGVRQIHGTDLPVTVFSDGYDEELQEILRLPGVCRATRQPDIIDLLLLARSRLLIASAGSTFSYWAGFLADAPVLLHPDHIFMPLRAQDVNQYYFEGGVHGPAESWPELLKYNIQAIDATESANIKSQK